MKPAVKIMLTTILAYVGIAYFTSQNPVEPVVPAHHKNHGDAFAHIGVVHIPYNINVNIDEELPRANDAIGTNEPMRVQYFVRSPDSIDQFTIFADDSVLFSKQGPLFGEYGFFTHQQSKPGVHTYVINAESLDGQILADTQKVMVCNEFFARTIPETYMGDFTADF